jgi:hypothetical protein
MSTYVLFRLVISVLSGVLFGSIGVVLLMPALMAWDSGDPATPMKVISYFSLSIIPVAVIASVLTCIFGYVFLLLDLIPIGAILLTFLYAKIVGD